MLTPIFHSDSPLYIQLYSFLKEQIEQGELKSFAKLPSIRQLSIHLNISKTTVESAYQQLLAEGYVESKPRSGLIVLPLESEAIIRDLHPPSFSAVRLDEAPHVDFQYGDIDLAHFPIKRWKKYMREAMSEENFDVFHYGEKQGDQLLRIEISKYLYGSRGISCHPKQIVLCAGTQLAVDLICQLLKLQGQEVAMENPGYDGVHAIFSQHKCKTIPISIEKDGLCIDELTDSHAKAVYVTPSHQFPYGMVLSIQKRMKLLHWAKEASSYIIEDDYDSEYRYEGHPISSLKSLDTDGRVLYLGTFSKSFLPALRTSYIVLPLSLVDTYQENYQFHSQSVSPIFQRALQQFMITGDFMRHIRKMRKIYHDKHQVLLSVINKYMGDKVEVIGEKAGLHLLLNVKGRDEHDLMLKAEKNHIRVYSTSSFWLIKKDHPRSLIMLGFGGISTEKIEEGIRLLSLAWFERKEGY
ncbi:MocR-like pyridoxine biosynthesis transcription factor PdxR [Cytobacillus purgationiresistens]|uniref:GntR family transcriptional regulator/MocR family aminotransferase n=1 Tax=Cytobacillus purgationiresistens TaxID=863449 RepID=A0ABU0AAW8_9BACI|nr:PLP-dependent aminotransferase family protein [Cytobacillus purgationiresistens]MDQ0268394.1 GntR family transcriptional regulator/MocR family aminotransferase [Cytobacillus purgationiresistens]